MVLGFNSSTYNPSRITGSGLEGVVTGRGLVCFLQKSLNATFPCGGLHQCFFWQLLQVFVNPLGLAYKSVLGINPSRFRPLFPHPLLPVCIEESCPLEGLLESKAFFYIHQNIVDMNDKRILHAIFQESVLPAVASIL